MAACFAAGDAAATRAEVAHQVARILIGRVNFHVHDGLEKRWTRLLHGFLEGQRTGNLERDIGRIHVVVFAVVEDRDRKSTRLNSSHSQISYAVFCLKKKKNT